MPSDREFYTLEKLNQAQKKPRQTGQGPQSHLCLSGLNNAPRHVHRHKGVASFLQTFGYGSQDIDNLLTSLLISGFHPQ